MASALKTHPFTLTARAPRKCGVCPTVFIPPKRHSQYCSPPCGYVGSGTKQRGKAKMQKTYPKKCEQCSKDFQARKMQVRFCSMPCAYKAKEGAQIDHPRNGDILGLVNKDRSREKQRANALIDAVRSGSLNIFTASPETRKAIAKAQDLTGRSILV